MNVDKLRAYHQKRPFVPFVLHMADGRSVRVDSHEFMWIIPGGRHIHVWQPNEDIHFIDTLLVTSLTYKASADDSGIPPADGVTVE